MKSSIAFSGSAEADTRSWNDGVSIVPGQTQLTRTPSRTYSAAMDRDSDSTAPLDAL